MNNTIFKTVAISEEMYFEFHKVIAFLEEWDDEIGLHPAVVAFVEHYEAAWRARKYRIGASCEIPEDLWNDAVNALEQCEGRIEELEGWGSPCARLQLPVCEVDE